MAVKTDREFQIHFTSEGGLPAMQTNMWRGRK